MADKLPKPKSKKSASSEAPAQADKPKSAKTKASPPPAPNAMTEEQRGKFVKKALKLDREFNETRDRCNSEVASARALISANERDWKKQGGSVNALKELVKLSKRDPDELAREVREINDLAKLAGIPIGYQLGLFEEGKSVATAIEDEKAAQNGGPQTIEQIEAEGYVAGKAAKPISVCGFPEETPEHNAFLKGWKRGQGENAGMTGTVKTPKATTRAASKTATPKAEAANGAIAH